MGVITQIRRGFDLICTIAGLVVLVLLGPWMLVTGASHPIPDLHELTSLDGTVVTCRETVSASVLLLAGRKAPFELQAGTCADVLGLRSENPTVSIFVVPASLKRGTSPLPSYGLTVEGKIVRYPQSDLDAARIDRTFRLAVGPLGTLLLIWLVVIVARSPGRLRLLLTGDEQPAAQMQ
ncbi:MAG TPA: hypothetical protein VGO18_35815 [Steroidobacteraceae bacterium]|nr:hypothetical protein [Steroidobacteraceae bacterium]